MPQRLRGHKIERRVQLLRRMTQQPALHAGRFFAQSADFDGYAFGRGAAAAAHRTAVKENRGRDAGYLAFPPRLFVAGKLGDMRKMLAQARIPGLEQRQQLVADPVAGESEMPIRGILPPGLPESAEVGFDGGTREAEHRTDDAPLGKP